MTRFVVNRGNRMIGKTISHYKILEKNGGGGILCAYNSNPTIANNTITDNICATMSGAGGGGNILVYVNCVPTII